MKFVNKKIASLIILTIIGILIIAGIILALKNWDGGLGNELQAGCQRPEYSADIEYDFLSSLDVIIEEPTDKVLEIEKGKKLFSLGKFKIDLAPYSVLRIPKLWLTFFSEELSEREDNLYGLEESYLSKVIIKRGKEMKEVDLGGGGKYYFLELVDCPLGNIEPVDKKTTFDFEVLLEIGCNNIVEGECLDNKNEPLDYIDGVELSARFRVFVESYQDFTKDIFVSTSFGYK